MFLWLVLALLLAGSLAAGEYVVALVPKAEEGLKKIEPHRGWIGLGLAANGLWFVLWYVILSIGSLFDAFRLFGLSVKLALVALLVYLTLTVASFLMAAVGFLVGFEKIAELTGKGDQLEQIREKVAPHQRTLGLASLGMVLWLLVLRIAFI